MPRNKITDLNDHLFEQLEKLSDPDMNDEDLEKEIKRSKAMSGLASNIIGAAKVTVDAMKLIGHGQVRREDLPLLLSGSKGEK